MTSSEEPPANPPRHQPIRDLLLAQALDACIAAERVEPGSAQRMISRQPAWARAELQHLLALAGSLDAAAANAGMSDEFRVAGRARLMQQIGGPPLAPVLLPTVRLVEPTAAAPVARVASGRRRRWLWRTTAGLAAALVATMATLTASASALPGEPLFSLKQAQEELDYRLAGDDPARTLALLRHAEARLDEAARLLRQGRVSDALVATQHYDQAVTRATATFVLGGVDDPDPGSGNTVAADIDSQLRQQQDQLVELLQSAPEPARRDLVEALEATRRGRELVGTSRPLELALSRGAEASSDATAEATVTIADDFRSSSRATARIRRIAAPRAPAFPSAGSSTAASSAGPTAATVPTTPPGAPAASPALSRPTVEAAAPAAAAGAGTAATVAGLAPATPGTGRDTPGPIAATAAATHSDTGRVPVAVVLTPTATPARSTVAAPRPAPPRVLPPTPGPAPVVDEDEDEPDEEAVAARAPTATLAWPAAGARFTTAPGGSPTPGPQSALALAQVQAAVERGTRPLMPTRDPDGREEAAQVPTAMGDSRGGSGSGPSTLGRTPAQPSPTAGPSSSPVPSPSPSPSASASPTAGPALPARAITSSPLPTRGTVATPVGRPTQPSVSTPATPSAPRVEATPTREPEPARIEQRLGSGVGTSSGGPTPETRPPNGETRRWEGR